LGVAGSAFGTTSSFPQLEQNFAALGFSVPHFAQNIVCCSSVSCAKIGIVINKIIEKKRRAVIDFLISKLFLDFIFLSPQRK
jgi:hypothetical protein